VAASRRSEGTLPASGGAGARLAAEGPRRDRFFSSAFLLQLERLGFISRRTHVGRVKGERKSPRRGSSVEFADYRPYEVGDDLRYVDWNAFGRLDRLYLKIFMDEEDLCVHLLLDASASMDYGHPHKFGYAVRLAAGLAFVGLVNLERVGVAVFRDRVSEGWLPTRGRNQFLPVEDFLAGLRPGGTTSFNESLRQYALRAKESGVAVLISDFLDPGGFESGLRALMERRFDIHVVHLLSPDELRPTLGGDLELVDAESGEIRAVSVDSETLRAYEAQLGAFLGSVEAFCKANEVNYHRVATDVALEDLFLRRLKGSLLL
jgi:uncharacterized protein (DUF58 family)